MHYNYIIYSSKRKRFYTGETQNLEERLSKHNSGGVRSTKGGIPWNLIWSKTSEDRSSARQLEKKIKSRGNRRFLEDQGFDTTIYLMN